MPSTQHFAWQLLLYGAMTLTYVCVGLSLLGARTTLRRWLAGSYLVVFNEYVVAFMMALCGYDPHEWLLGHPQTTQFFGLALISMWVTLAAVLVFSRNSRLPRLLDGLPPLRIPESQLRTLSLLVSFTCAVLSIVMSAGGYHGYYLAEEYISNPPLWRDVAGLLVTIGSMLSFVLVLFCYTRHGRILGAEWMLLLVWTGAGLASGFKMQVVFPFFCVLVAAWLANRLGSRHWAFFALAFTLAYGVIEPMRAWRWSADHDNGREGLIRSDNDGGGDPPGSGRGRFGLSRESGLHRDCRPDIGGRSVRPGQRLPRKTTGDISDICQPSHSCRACSGPANRWGTIHATSRQNCTARRTHSLPRRPSTHICGADMSAS